MAGLAEGKLMIAARLARFGATPEQSHERSELQPF
jgi:hypothetical protein